MAISGHFVVLRCRALSTNNVNVTLHLIRFMLLFQGRVLTTCKTLLLINSKMPLRYRIMATAQFLWINLDSVN